MTSLFGIPDTGRVLTHQILHIPCWST